LYDSDAIKAKRTKRLQLLERLEQEKSEEEMRRDLGLPAGVTMQAFLHLSNHAIYGGLTLVSLQEHDLPEDNSEGEERAPARGRVLRIASAAREVAASCVSEEMLAAVEDMDGTYQSQLALQRGSNIHIPELLDIGCVETMEQKNPHRAGCVEGGDGEGDGGTEDRECLPSQAQVQQDRAIVHGAQGVVRAVLACPLSGLSLADYLTADEASRDREHGTLGADKTGDLDDYTVGAGAEREEDDDGEDCLLSPGAGTSPEYFKDCAPASNNDAPEAALAPVPDAERAPLMCVSKYNLPVKSYMPARAVRQPVAASTEGAGTEPTDSRKLTLADASTLHSAVYAPQAPARRKLDDSTSRTCAPPLVVGGKTLNIPSAAAALKAKVEEEQLDIQLLAPAPVGSALERPNADKAAPSKPEQDPPAAMVVSLKVPSVTVKKSSGSVLYTTELKKRTKPASEPALKKKVLATLDFTADVVLPLKVSLQDLKCEPSPGTADGDGDGDGDIHVHRNEFSPRAGAVAITRSRHAQIAFAAESAPPQSEPAGIAVSAFDMVHSMLSTSQFEKVETAAVYLKPTAPIAPKPTHKMSQGPGALVGLRMQESLEAVALERRFHQDNKIATPNFGVAGGSGAASKPVVGERKGRETTVVTSASPRWLDSNALLPKERAGSPALELEATGNPLEHRARSDAKKAAASALQQNQKDAEKEKWERTGADMQGTQSKNARMSTEYVSKVRGRTTGHSVRIAGHVEDREVGPVTYDRGLVDLLRRPSVTNPSQPDMASQEFSDSLPGSPVHGRRPSATDRQKEAAPIVSATAPADTAPAEKSVLSEQRSILDEANAQMDIVRKAFKERERLQQQVEALAAGLEAHELLHRNMLEELERGLASHSAYMVSPPEPAMPMISSTHYSSTTKPAPSDGRSPDSMFGVDISRHAEQDKDKVKGKENSVGSGYIGNKSPAKMSGIKTTMVDIHSYDRSNVTDVCQNIENMRVPKSQLDHPEEVDPAQIRSLVMLIDSSMSDSQEQELAFVEEEMRRRLELKRLMKNIQVHGTTSIKPPQDKLLNIKSKVKELSASRGHSHGHAPIAAPAEAGSAILSSSPPFAILPAKFI